jgi:ABC-type sugar transport system substrate-binding protein
MKLLLKRLVNMKYKLSKGEKNMKKKFRRILTSTLAIVLAASLCLGFVGCTKPADGDQGSTNNAGDNTEKVKVGMIWYGNTDAMGGTFYSWANHAAEVLNVELVWKLGSFTTADELTDCENLISAGCEGIYFIPMDTSANLQLGNACNDAGVYWSTSNRDIIDNDVLEACEANPYFVNRIYDNSYDVCKQMVKVMAEKGIKEVCMLSGDPTDAMMVDRNKGFIDGAKEFGVKILATSQLVSGDSATNVDSVNNFLTLYPNMQGILAVSGTAGVGEAIITALESSNREKGSIKVAAFDTFDGNKEAFENGWLAASCGGYTSECLVSFISLVNRIRGNVISDEVAVMSLSPLLITSAEEMDIFSQYVDNPEVQLYSDDMIKSLVGPDVKVEDYQKVLDDWSIDFVKSAVGLE